MARTNVLPADAPAWVKKDRQINELIDSCSFLSAHPMKCIHGRFFTVDGLAPDEGSLKQIIFDDISEWKESGVARKVDDLLKTIKLMAYSEDIPLHYDRIHVANGTWYLDGRFTGDKEYCRNRLAVDYNPDAGVPGVWLRFLSELLIKWNNRVCKSTVWHCVSRVLKKSSGIDCPARTIKEEVLQAAVVTAVNDAWSRKESILPELRENIRSVLEEDTDQKIAEIDAAVKQKQAELLDAGRDQEKIDEIGDAIMQLREERQQILTQAAMRKDVKDRIEDLASFLDEQTQAVTEYSDVLVRRLIERITVYDEMLVVEFKSGLEIEVDA